MYWNVCDYRNEVWRYPPRHGSRYEQYLKCWFRGKNGLTIAFGLAATVIGLEKTYEYFYPPVHHHKVPYFPKSVVPNENQHWGTKVIRV